VYNRIENSDLGKELQNEAKAKAASFVFDLDDGDVNSQISKRYPALVIYNQVEAATSLTVSLDGSQYLLKPYYSELSEKTALALLEDTYSAMYQALIESKVKAQLEIEPWGNNDLQFTRLLGEFAQALEFTDQQMDMLNEVTDMSVSEINEILGRASTSWDSIKYNLPIKEQYTTLVLSTAHISEEDIRYLSELDESHLLHNMVMERDTGIFVKLYEEFDPQVCADLEQSFAGILEKATSLGYRMIEFDLDAPVVAELPVYEWAS
jgi:hypothetical protein